MMQMLSESHFCKNKGNFILKLDWNIELDEFSWSANFQQFLEPVELWDERVWIVQQRCPELFERLDVTYTHEQSHKIFANRIDIREFVA